MAAPTFVGIRTSGWVGPPASVDLTPLGVLGGDLIVACAAARGGTAVNPPGGFVLAQPKTAPATLGGDMTSYLWRKTAAGGEGIIATTGMPPGDLLSLMVAVYRGLATPHVAAVANKSVTDGSTGPPNPSITPPAGRPAVVVAWVAIDPNYVPALSGGWALRAADNGGATPRTYSQLYDQLVALTAGSYAGSYSGAGGETSWALQNVAFMTGVGQGFPRGYWARELPERIRRLWQGWARRPSSVLAPA